VVGRSTNSAGVFAEINAANDAEVLRRSGTTLGFGTVATAGIANSAVTYAKIQNSAAAGLSVLGRSTNSAGVFAEINAASDNTILRRSGTAIGFGTVTATGGALTQATARLLGRTTASTGSVEAIALATNSGLVLDSGTIYIGGNISSLRDLTVTDAWRIQANGTGNAVFYNEVSTTRTINLNQSVFGHTFSFQSDGDTAYYIAREYDGSVNFLNETGIQVGSNGSSTGVQIYYSPTYPSVEAVASLDVGPTGVTIWSDKFGGQIGLLVDEISVQAYKPLVVQDYTTVGLPTASTVPYGIVYNTTTSKMQYSDGAAWVDFGSGGGGGGTPGGSTTQVQYNNAGAFGGSANFTWDSANSIVNTIRYGMTGQASAPGTSVASGQIYYDTTELDIRARLSGQWINITKPRIVITAATSLTLDESYRNAYIIFTAATLVTVTGPSLNTGFQVTLVKAGTGNVQFAPLGPTVLDAISDTIIALHASATFIKKDSTTWQGLGALEALGTTNSVVYWTTLGMSSEGAFTYNETTNRLTVPIVNHTPAAGDISSPTDGDIWYNSTTNKFRARQNGATTDVIISAGAGTVTSVNVSGGSTGLSFSGGPVTTTGTISMAGTLLTSFGGTGLTSYTAGDILYYTSSTALSKLAAAATGNVLLSGTAPSWGKVGLTTHVSGILPTANGGLGVNLSAPGADRILFWDHSALAYAYLTVSTGLNITGTALTATTLTNSAANTELAMSNGTNLIGSDIYVTNSGTSPDVAIGDPTVANTVVTIRAQGSAADVSLELQAQGAADMEFTATDFYFNDNAGIGYILMRATATGASFISPFNNTSFEFDGGNGTSVTINGASLTIRGGDAYGLSGSGNGGDLILRAGVNGPSGGSDGNIKMPSLPTSSAGLPSGSIWNNLGILNIV
jgi:hypothetical protein